MRFAEPPSLADIEALGRAAIGDLPPVFRAELVDAAVLVEDFAEDSVLDELDIESPFDLLGLYQGAGQYRKETQHIAQAMNVIFLYRRPILDMWCETGDDLATVVRHVLIHEIGHHLGFSDDDMARIEEQP